MPSINRSIVAILSTFFLMLAREPVKAQQIREIVVPSARKVSLTEGEVVLSDVMKEIAKQSELSVVVSQFRVPAGFAVKKFRLAGGKSALWTTLGEIATAGHISFDGHFGRGIEAIPESGPAVGYSVAGPALVLLREIKVDNTSANFQLDAHCYPWEAQDLSIQDLKVRLKKGEPIAGSILNTTKEHGRLSGDLSYDSESWPVAIEGILKAEVRTKLFEAMLPIGKDAKATLGDLSIRSVKVKEVLPDALTETFEISWKTGLPPEDEKRMEKILKLDLAGLIRPEDEDFKWFHEQTQKVIRYRVIDHDVIDDKNETTSSAFATYVTHVSLATIEVQGTKKSLMGNRFRLILGFQEPQSFNFSIKVKQ